MDFALTDEQELIRETARRFTDNEIVPRAKENARDHHFDVDLVRKIADQGYLGAIVPREYGGAGPRLHDLRADRRGDRPRRQRDAHGRLGADLARVQRDPASWGTEEQKQHYLPKLCSGEWLGCFGLTEPDTGSDAANQRTRARRDGDRWIINGAKMWISMGNHAKVALVFAQTDPELKHRGLAAFLVDTDQPGFQPQEIHGKMGLHGSDTASISLDDVEATEMLGEVGDGFKVAMSALDSGPLLASPPAASASARAASTSRSPTRRSASSSTGRSRRSSSCRRCSPT